MREPLLEVIAATAEDAAVAERGGAHRLEVVRAIDVGGLTPDLETFRQIRQAVSIPLRVMLRTNGGFSVSGAELERLCAEVLELRRAGAEEFVLGFLGERGNLDLPSIEVVIASISPCCWTLHHSFDHATDAVSAWRSAADLPGLGGVLSGGIQGGLGKGLLTLCDRADWQTESISWLAGGGLVLEYVGPLADAGIRHFHIGRAARVDYSWDRPVNEAEVRRWRRTIDQRCGC